jgi:hypothetical protein
MRPLYLLSRSHLNPSSTHVVNGGQIGWFEGIESETEKFDLFDREVMVIWNPRGAGFRVQPFGEGVA